MKKGKATVSIGLIYVILLGVFNLLVFTIFKTHTKVFWLSYAFMTVAFIVQILSMFLSFKTADVETAFFGIPLASFSIYYLCASLIVGAVFMVFQNAGFTLALVIQTLILAAFLIIAIISLLARDTVQAIGENVKQNVTNLKSILVDVEMLSSSCTDPELKQALNKLADTVKYSDPMSTTAVELVEQRIMRKISELRVSIDNNQIPDALQVCKELELLYVERNKKLALQQNLNESLESIWRWNSGIESIASCRRTRYLFWRNLHPQSVFCNFRPDLGCSLLFRSHLNDCGPLGH